MKINKRGSGVGDMVEMIPILIMISVIAITVFGISASYYSYNISVRDIEARLLARGMIECLSGDGVLNLNEIGEIDYEKIISHCGITGSERFYVGINIFNSSGDKVVVLSEGDSGLLWVRDLFERAVLTGNAVLGGNNKNVEKIARYNPGYFSFEYPLLIIKEQKSFEGVAKVEVLINYEK